MNGNGPLSLAGEEAAPPPPLTVLHEDDALLAIDKPAGLLVHRTALDHHERDTVIERLRRQRGTASARDTAPSAEPAEDWLGAAHRLDKPTSGVLLIARRPDVARTLGTLFDEGRVQKHYLALVRGWPADDEALIDRPLARDPELPSTGQLQLPASTRYRVLHRYEWPFSADGRHPTSRYALVAVSPHTGRRQQIRRHFKQIAHPLIGDTTHGKAVHNRAVAQWLGQSRLWLHAVALELPHPLTGQPWRVTAPLPAGWPWPDGLPAPA